MGLSLSRLFVRADILIRGLIFGREGLKCMSQTLVVLVEALSPNGKDHRGRHVLAARQLLAKHLGDHGGIPAARVAAGGTQNELLVAQVVGNRQGKANALTHGIGQLLIAHVVLRTRTAHIGRRKHNDVCIGMETIAGKTNSGNHQRAIAIKLAVDVAAAVFAIPVALLGKDVIEKRVLAQRLLETHETLIESARGIGIRTKIKDRQVTELGAAAAVFQNCRASVGIEDTNLGQTRLLAFRCLFCHRSGHAVDALALRASAIDLGRKTLANRAGVGLALASALLTPSVRGAPSLRPARLRPFVLVLAMLVFLSPLPPRGA